MTAGNSLFGGGSHRIPRVWTYWISLFSYHVLIDYIM